MQASYERQKLPFYIISGFLGAGKTTFIRELCQKAPNLTVEIFVNEFADKGIDQDILSQTTKGKPKLLANGCLCCSLYDEFLAKLQDSYQKWQNQRAYPDLVILESSGLFLPDVFLQGFFGSPFFLEHFAYKGLITIIDIFFGMENLSQFSEAQKQISFADVILLSKTEQAPQQIIEQLEKKIREINQEACLYEKLEFLVKGNLLQKLEHRSIKPPQQERALAHNQHEITSFVFAISKEEALSLSLTQIESFFGYLHEQFGNKILRLKALIHRQAGKQAWLFQMVQGVFYPYEEVLWEKDIAEEAYFVVITSANVKQQVKMAFSAFFNRIAIDTPDREALFHNPLVIHQG